MPSKQGGMMNIYCKATFNQLTIAIQSILDIIETLDNEDLKRRPTANKHSIGELLEHISLICQADLHISEGATEEQMHAFYSQARLESLDQIKADLTANLYLLKVAYESFDPQELQQKTTSYWGVTYTRFEWLLEILAHVYHHRGQLHAILVHSYQMDPAVALFE